MGTIFKYNNSLSCGNCLPVLSQPSISTLKPQKRYKFKYRVGERAGRNLKNLANIGYERTFT